MLDNLNITEVTRKIMEKDAAEAEVRRQQKAEISKKKPEGGRMFDIKIDKPSTKNRGNNQ